MLKEISMCIVTPLYKLQMTQFERLRLKISLQNIGEHKHVFIRPFSHHHVPIVEFPNSGELTFEDTFFRSKLDYSRLLLTRRFYETFELFDYILILQTDAILVRDLDLHALQDFDYLGAPWVPEKKLKVFRSKLWINTRRFPWIKATKVSVGNGGLSLRKVSSMISVAKIIEDHYPFLANGSVHEDTAISYVLKKHGFQIPPTEIAHQTFCEHASIDATEIPSVNGFHGLNRFNPNLELSIFKRFNR